MRRIIMFVQAGFIAAAAFGAQACFDGILRLRILWRWFPPRSVLLWRNSVRALQRGKTGGQNYYGDSDDRHEWRDHEGYSWSHHETPRQEHHEERQEQHEPERRSQLVTM